MNGEFEFSSSFSLQSLSTCGANGCYLCSFFCALWLLIVERIKTAKTFCLKFNSAKHALKLFVLLPKENGDKTNFLHAGRAKSKVRNDLYGDTTCTTQPKTYTYVYFMVGLGGWLDKKQQQMWNVYRRYKIRCIIIITFPTCVKHVNKLGIREITRIFILRWQRVLMYSVVSNVRLVSLRTYKVVVTALDICTQFNIIYVISEWFFIIECNVMNDSLRSKMLHIIITHSSWVGLFERNKFNW